MTCVNNEDHMFKNQDLSSYYKKVISSINKLVLWQLHQKTGNTRPIYEHFSSLFHSYFVLKYVLRFFYFYYFTYVAGISDTNKGMVSLVPLEIVLCTRHLLSVLLQSQLQPPSVICTGM